MKKVIFRDYQEEVADDHNNLQDYVYEQFDDVTADTISAARRYAGLIPSKTGQVEITVAPGRVYDGGKVYKRRTSLTQSMATYTAAAAKRIVTVSAYGNENLTDTTERDFLVDVDTNTVEPQSVSMSTSRDVQVVFTAGAEAASPVPPPTPATHVVIAYITMDTTQVVSVDVQVGNQVESTDALDVRATSLESFRDRIDPRVTSLASDLASLQTSLNSRAGSKVAKEIFLDLARLKAALRFPDDASNYGTDFYLDQSKSDMTNSANLGFDSRVEMGVRFPDANASQFELSLFSANDPNAKLTNGVLLPAYSDQLKIATGTYNSELGISQYGYQTFNMKTGYMSKSRLRYGGYYWQCSNGAYYSSPGQPAGASSLYDFNTTGFQAVSQITYLNNSGYETNQTNTWWYDTWSEPFMYTETTDHIINGAQVAQSFLVSNDIWATKLGFYVTSKAAAEDIHIALCELTAGVPDLGKCMLKTTYQQANIVTGWNRIAITPTFLQKGKRYALVFVSNANHKIGMSDGGQYLDGTFFYSTDTIYYQGDLTKDMMIEVWGAKFNSSSVTVEFNAINLDGGFRAIDILANQWVPDSTQLFWEVQPNGSGAWLPLTDRDLGAALGTAPPLARFRARFVGTTDMAAAITLTGSRVKVFRPKTAFKHISTVINLTTPDNQIVVRTLLENFDETPHDMGCQLYVNGAYVSPSATVTQLKDTVAKRYSRDFTFNLGSATSSFRIVFTGTTNSSANTFHVAERDYYTE